MIIQVMIMSKQYKAIKEIRDNFISANKAVFTDEKEANRHDFETTISLTAYHNLIMADVVELFYDIQVQNINNLVDEIEIAAYNTPTSSNKKTAGNAQIIHEQIISSIDDDFGRFNNMDTKERAGLASNLAVTFMSLAVIEKARTSILDNTMAHDNTYKPDIMSHVKNAECEHFIDYAKNLSDDFKKKYGKQLANLYMMKELLTNQIPKPVIEAGNDPDTPEIKRSNKAKLKTN